MDGPKSIESHELTESTDCQRRSSTATQQSARNPNSTYQSWAPSITVTLLLPEFVTQILFVTDPLSLSAPTKASATLQGPLAFSSSH